VIGLQRRGSLEAATISELYDLEVVALTVSADPESMIA
jgi:hypothetical protein